MVTSSRRRIVYERDEDGSVFAVELVEAEEWHESLLEPLDAEAVDARVVRLGRGAAPSRLPRWLVVEPAREAPAAGRRVAEPAAAYAVRPPAEQAWSWSPTYRGPGASLSDFLAAGAAAVRHPEPVPAESRRRLELIADFADRRPSTLRRIATLRGDALERWLRYAFGEPDRFADEILLQRMEGERAGSPAHEAVAVLRFLRGAEIAAAATEHADLALDRRVLLEQASPWRFYEGGAFAPALQAARAWQRRYRVAYDRYYNDVIEAARAVRDDLLAAQPAAEALRRFDALSALGAPLGGAALDAYAEAEARLDQLPPDADPELSRTGGVTLGAEPAAFADARDAVEAVRAALEEQRRRLASETVRAVLARPGVPDLDRLLQAIAASDLDGIERVLTDDLATHIERLLHEAQESPLAMLALRVPRVDAGSIDSAVEAFREILEAALAAVPNGTVTLREDRA